MAKCSFKHNGVEVVIEPFTYGFASKTLKDELSINLLNVFEGDNLQFLMTQILLNDEFALKCWWYFLNKTLSSDDPANAYDREIDNLTPEGMAEFKEAFWAAIVSFFDPTRREMLLQVRKGFKELMVTGVQDLLKETLASSSTSSQPEQVSAEGTLNPTA